MRNLPICWVRRHWACVMPWWLNRRSDLFRAGVGAVTRFVLFLVGSGKALPGARSPAETEHQGAIAIEQRVLPVVLAEVVDDRVKDASHASRSLRIEENLRHPGMPYLFGSSKPM